MDLLALWFGLRAPVSRRAYALSGIGLMTLKVLVDQGLALASTGKPWPLAAYVLPSTTLKVEAIGPHPSWALWVMALVALPFLWIGVSMTIRRAADAGVSPWLGILFLVPLVNYVAMVVFALLPSRSAAAQAPLALGPFRGPPEAPPVSQPGPVPRELESALLGVISPIAIGLGMALLSVQGFAVYGAALFFATPFVMGLTTAILHNRRRLHSLGATVGLACLGVALTGLAMLLFAIEGVLCLLMAAPLALVAAAFGAVVGHSLVWQARRSSRAAAAMLVALPALGGVEARVLEPTLREVTTSVEIDAPPERVWENVVGFSELPAPPEWFFRQGIAYPVRATIDGEGVGAVRRCEFSTGPFVEPITIWDPPRRLGFDVTSQPPSMTEWSPYRHVDAPHLEGYMVSRRGEFRLVPLPGGRTRLEGSTWYTLSIFPETYWVGWGELLLHAIHGRVLEHVRDLSER